MSVTMGGENNGVGGVFGLLTGDGGGMVFMSMSNSLSSRNWAGGKMAERGRRLLSFVGEMPLHWKW